MLCDSHGHMLTPQTTVLVGEWREWEVWGVVGRGVEGMGGVVVSRGVEGMGGVVVARGGRGWEVW